MPPSLSQIFDGHNDLYGALAAFHQKSVTLCLYMPWALRQADFSGRSLDLKQPQPQLHTDIARLKQGKVGAQVPLSNFETKPKLSKFCLCSSGAFGSRHRSTTLRRLQSPWSKSAESGSCSSCAQPI